VRPAVEAPGAALPRSFSARDTVEVAQRLLGQRLACLGPDGWRVGRIVETEAYLGPDDLACHSAKGRTRRTEVMFGPPGHAYVYLVYGMHRCVNVVTGAGAAVLIRALELHGGRGERADGPGRLTKALGITLEHDGHPLDTSPLMLLSGEPAPAIARGPRIGVDYAGPYWSRRALRFWIDGSPFVSGAPRRGRY
jgi:DNA-3-methyladenine glycosylase